MSSERGDPENELEKNSIGRKKNEIRKGYAIAALSY